MTLAVAVAAGGTGGHLFPALAVADALRAQRSDVELTFIGSTRHLDRSLLHERDVRIETTEVTSFASARDLPATALRLGRAVVAARRILRRDRTQVVIGFGGYPSLPAILAAATMRLPRIVHEANALDRLGLANRLGARTGAEIWAGFAATGRGLGRPVRVCGVPLRPAIRDLDRGVRRAQGRARFGCDPASKIVLCLGGSLGARSIDDAVVELAQAGLPGSWELICSTGAAEHASVVGRAGNEPRLHLEAFIDEMDLAYAAADVVVARAGASTVAEIEHLGLPAIVVPLPIAREGEQDRNAAALIERGAAIRIADRDLNGDTLRAAIAEQLDVAPPLPDPRHASAAAQLANRIIELAEARDA